MCMTVYVVGGMCMLLRMWVALACCCRTVFCLLFRLVRLIFSHEFSSNLDYLVSSADLLCLLFPRIRTQPLQPSAEGAVRWSSYILAPSILAVVLLGLSFFWGFYLVLFIYVFFVSGSFSSWSSFFLVFAEDRGSRSSFLQVSFFLCVFLLVHLLPFGPWSLCMPLEPTSVAQPHQCPT